MMYLRAAERQVGERPKGLPQKKKSGKKKGNRPCRVTGTFAVLEKTERRQTGPRVKQKGQKKGASHRHCKCFNIKGQIEGKKTAETRGQKQNRRVPKKGKIRFSRNGNDTCGNYGFAKSRAWS